MMYKLLMGVFCLLAVVSSANASITCVDLANDIDGAILCNAPWDQAEQVNVVGNQYRAPAHIVGTITTDTILDPNLTIRNTIDNDTGFAWTGYQVNLYLPVTFTISNIRNYIPGDWNGAVTQNPIYGTWMIDGNALNAYKATIYYTPGTTVDMGDTFDYSYKMTFQGATSYQFTQEMIPVPEPATMALLALGGLAVIRRRK